jgi:hypothetical protein
MLDTYCSTLSDEAQLKIALRLANIALPVWEKYHRENIIAMIKVNELIGGTNRISGAAEKLDAAFLRRALEKIQLSLDAAKEKSPAMPVPQMKSDATLSPMLATIMQPLTNAEWDHLLPQSMRLAYTMVFNILIWILKRRRTPDNETHIYVAINQAADVLMTESIMSTEDINKILSEYKSDLRDPAEESAWENAFTVGRSEPMDHEDVIRRILGENVSKDQCGSTLGKEVLRQMRYENKSFWDEMEEYQSGTSTTYSYNKEKESFWRHEFDVVVGSFSNHIPMTESEMLDFVSRLKLVDLRTCGFEV